jgi:hypothetical protein
LPEPLPAGRELARYLLVLEVGKHPEPAALAEAVARVDARLRGRLAPLIGPTGYTILVARAVRLAYTDVLDLAGVTVDGGTSGGLLGIREFALASADPAVAEAGLSTILAHVFGLLITFIGEDLTIRLVRGGWPELAHGPAESER